MMQKMLKLGGAVALAIAMVSIPVAAQDAATADGIYTEAQAALGAEVYDVNCAGCHASDLTGTPGGPGIGGSRFKAKWSKQSVGDFYTKISETMPAGMGGSLTETEYLDVVSYILSVNKFAPGEAELTADLDKLNAITIGVAAAQ